MRFATTLFEIASGSTNPQSFWTSALGLIGQQVRFEAAAFVLGPEVGRHGASIVGKDQATIRYVRLFAANHERFQADLARGQVAIDRHGAYLDHDVYSLRDRSTLAFFSEIVRPQRITSQIIARPAFRGRVQGALHIERIGRGTRLSLRELERVQAMLPLLTLAHAAVAAPPAASLSAATEDRLANLTAREREVAQLVARGLRNREIATLLGISPHTVHNQLARIYEKTGTAGRVELTVLWRDE